MLGYLLDRHFELVELLVELLDGQMELNEVLDELLDGHLELEDVLDELLGGQMEIDLLLKLVRTLISRRITFCSKFNLNTLIMYPPSLSWGGGVLDGECISLSNI